MLLNPKYRYVSLDFETTGLDSKKDYIIQIGLVVFDSKGYPIDEFASYIKPPSTVQITSMVEYVTGVKADDIAHAPIVADVKQKFISFFDENTIII
jgi:DNA polymerase III epsilon subunit-like protein